ncbi:MAG: ORC1-type DNA replication protein [Candidatus Methanofastidiosa archaeon]|nr:ORC1-type DNA replication protein [Candidatus Methanofastidiosa archaeon]
MDIKDMLMSDETLFRDEEVFDPNYLPEELLFRDKELQSLVALIKPGLRGGKPHNTLVIGPPGTGKTTTIHFLFDEVEKASDKMVTVHVNCKLLNTKFSVVSEIHKRIYGFRPPDTGVPYTSIYDKIMTNLGRKGQSLLVALDDVDFLFEEKYANDIMYDILRAYEHFPNVRTGIVAILSKEDFREVLATKLYSIFMPQEVIFPPYSMSETYEILRMRAHAGFFPGVISDELVEHIAEYTTRHGDLRVGISLLSSSGLIAESKAKRKIELEDIEAAYEKKARFVTLEEKLSVLSEGELKLLKEIALDGGIRSGKLYDKVGNCLNKKTFSQALNKLETYGLIDSKFITVGRGRSRSFYTRSPEEDVLLVIDDIAKR